MNKNIYLKKYIKYFEDNSFSNDEQKNILDLFIPIKDKGFEVSIVRYGKQIVIHRDISSVDIEDYLYSILEIQDDLEFSINYLEKQLELKVIINIYFYPDDISEIDYQTTKLKSKAYNNLESISKSMLIEQMEIHISK